MINASYRGDKGQRYSRLIKLSFFDRLLQEIKQYEEQVSNSNNNVSDDYENSDTSDDDDNNNRIIIIVVAEAKDKEPEEVRHTSQNTSREFIWVMFVQGSLKVV